MRNEMVGLSAHMEMRSARDTALLEALGALNAKIKRNAFDTCVRYMPNYVTCLSLMIAMSPCRHQMAIIAKMVFKWFGAVQEVCYGNGV